jgi:hypothetical protein
MEVHGCAICRSLAADEEMARPVIVVEGCH